MILHMLLLVKHKIKYVLSRDDKYIELYSDDYFVVYERIIDN